VCICPRQLPSARANIDEVAHSIGQDSRIGPKLLHCHLARWSVCSRWCISALVHACPHLFGPFTFVRVRLLSFVFLSLTESLCLSTPARAHLHLRRLLSFVTIHVHLCSPQLTFPIRTLIHMRSFSCVCICFCLFVFFLTYMHSHRRIHCTHSFSLMCLFSLVWVN